MQRYKFYLIAIIILASFLRLWSLDTNPNGLFCDEALNGYDAYSILKTGRDSTGEIFLLLIPHFNQYLEPLYVYLSIPSVGLLGLNEFSVRFPAAIFGILTILSTFFLTRKLFNENIALIAIFILAVSPWHLQHSRMGFEKILVPFFVTLGILLFLKGLKDSKFLIYSSIVLGLSVYTYPTMKVFLPILVVILLYIYRKEIIQCLRLKQIFKFHLAISIILFISLVAPLTYLTILGKGTTRFYEMSVFLTSREPLKQFIMNFLEHLSFNFLFLKGDPNLRHSIPHFGQILLVLAPFILISLIFFVKERKKEQVFLGLWVIAGVIPAALTNEGIPHASRTIQIVPCFEIIAAFGLYYTLLSIQKTGKVKQNFKSILKILIVSLLITNIIVFLHAYFFLYPKNSADWWQYGLRETINYSIKNSNKYNQIVITNKIEQPYIFPLFYAKIDPAKYHGDKSLGEFIICNTDVQNYYLQNLQNKNLYIVRPQELPNAKIKKNVYYPLGNIAFKIVE